jgi:hypothetical protein
MKHSHANLANLHLIEKDQNLVVTLDRYFRFLDTKDIREQ